MYLKTFLSTRHLLFLLMFTVIVTTAYGLILTRGVDLFESNETKVRIVKRQARSKSSADPKTPADPKSSKVGSDVDQLVLLLENIDKKDIPGIPFTRFVKLKKPYKDGKQCITGQDQLTPEEHTIYFKYLNDQGRIQAAHDIGISVPEYLHEQQIMGFEGTQVIDYRVLAKNAEKWGKENCETKNCRPDLLLVLFTCGPWKPNHAFEDLTSCFTGEDAVPEAQLGGFRLGKRLEDIPREFINQMRDTANEKFLTRNCKSKKCHYDFRRDWFLCGKDPNFGNRLSINILNLLLAAVLATSL